MNAENRRMVLTQFSRGAGGALTLRRHGSSGGPLERKDVAVNKSLAALGLVAGLAGGAFIGVALGVPTLSGAQTPSTTTPTTAAAPSGQSSGTQTAPSSNENATHEAGESAAREAAENNGSFRPGGHGSNEDPTHEASESPSREAAENAAANSGSTATPTAPTNG
jgi:hypothetical protein